MARLIDVLHADDNAADQRSLEVLIERTKASGLDLEVTPLARDVELPAAVEDAAYRVVQEGLTNAIKHASANAVTVCFGVAGAALEIDVRNAADGSESRLAATGAGLGLKGMRERVEALGGTLDAGPDRDGGWRLFARLPLAEHALSPTR